MKARRQYVVRTVLVPILTLVIGLGGYLAYRHLWAQRHYQQAEQALAGRNFVAAHEHLTCCLEVWPSSAEVHFLAARTARRAAAYDQAEQHLRNYQRLQGLPELVELERALAKAQQGDWADVQDLLVAYVQHNHPDSALILEALTQGYMKSYCLPQAHHCLTLWLQREPDNVQARIWHGEVTERVHERAQALSDYARALELDPNRDDARLHLAELLLALHRSTEAALHFQRLRQQQPENLKALLGLGRCESEQGEPDEADRLFAQVLVHDPENVDALSGRAGLAQQRGDFAAAESYWRSAAGKAPHSREIIYNLMLCLQQRGKRLEAEEYAAKLKTIKAALQRLDQLTRKIPEAPHDAALRHEVGMLFLASGQEWEGLRWLTSALREDPAYQPTHQALADYYERTGRPDLAAQHRMPAPAGKLGSTRGRQ